MICSKCGNSFSDNIEKCPNCGFDIGNQVEKMSSRFVRKKIYKEKLHAINMPIIIEKYALIYDADLKKNLIQIRFRNISNSKIASVELLVKVLDENNFQKNVKYTFKGLEVSPGELFGEKDAIYIDVLDVISYEFVIEKLVFSAGAVLHSNVTMKKIKEPQEINSLNHDEREAYVSLINEKVGYVNIKNIVSEYEDLWFCVCGSIQQKADGRCRNCLVIFDEASQLNQKDVLQKRIEKIKRDKEESELRRKVLQKKIIKYASCICGALLIVFGAIKTTQFIEKQIDLYKQYKEAVTLIDNHEYKDARKMLYELGDYRDSDTLYARIDELEEEYNNACVYDEAVAEMNSKDYETAIMLFGTIENYSDAGDKKKECYYLGAQVWAEEKNYEEAIDNLSNIVGYKDSDDKIKEYKYQWGMLLFEDDEYILAAEKFEELNDYLDSTEKISESYYQLALKEMKLTSYDIAIEYFEKVKGKDKNNAKIKIKECNEKILLKKQREMYKNALQLAKRGKLDIAISQLESLPEDYNDAKDALVAIKELKENPIIGTWKNSESYDSIEVVGNYIEGEYVFDVKIGSFNYYDCVMTHGAIVVEEGKYKSDSTSGGSSVSGSIYLGHVLKSGYDDKYADELSIISNNKMKRVEKYYHYKNSDDDNPTIKTKTTIYVREEE